VKSAHEYSVKKILSKKSEKKRERDCAVNIRKRNDGEKGKKEEGHQTPYLKKKGGNKSERRKRKIFRRRGRSCEAKSVNVRGRKGLHHGRTGNVS